MASGILLIDKPAGLTSFEVVRRVRMVLQVRKVGHLGTLDPFATGLLPLCLGEATKLAPFLMAADKTYLARLKLGEETDTQDLTGQVVARCEKLPAEEEIRRAAAGLVGEISQVPPMYSAVHHRGERLYRLARRGETVAPEPRAVTIHELTVADVAGAEVTIRVRCSKGTYIRTLGADLGRVLGCGAHLTGLRRMAVGPFRVEDALPLADLEHLPPEEIRSRIIPLARCLPGMRAVQVGPGEARSLRQGRVLSSAENNLAAGERVRVLLGEELVAVACVDHREGKAVLQPVRVWV
jgi:tRNA pseudouridine55 synthase